MKGNTYTMFFAAVTGTFCALLLTAVGAFTAPYQQANAKAEETLNILAALNVPFEADASASELLEVFEKNVTEKQVADSTLYIYSKPGSSAVEGVAFKFSGSGLWGPIKGLMALEADRRTIRGITFYEQEETPGLGAEITADWFRERFVGKKIIDSGGDPGIVITAPDGKEGQNKIDGISGATITCDKVQAMLNDAIEKFMKESGSDGK